MRERRVFHASAGIVLGVAMVDIAWALPMSLCRSAVGEEPREMEFHAFIEDDGETRFRDMKAIPTAEKPCLA